MDKARGGEQSELMDIALAVLATWLLANVLVVLWSLHRRAFVGDEGRVELTALVPAPRGAANGPVTAQEPSALSRQ